MTAATRAPVTQRDVTPSDDDGRPDPLATLGKLQRIHAATRTAWEGPAASPLILGDTIGATVPRQWTQPLRELKPAVLDDDGTVLEPATSYGFGVIEFARDTLLEPLDPWQEWLVIHAGELLPDGRPRFRTVLALVARQNGKTHLLKVLLLYWLFVERWPLSVGMSTTLDYAKEAWSKAVASIVNGHLKSLMPATRGRGILDNNNKTQLTTAAGCVYRLAARNRKGGRSLSIDRLVVDELREHDSYDAWSAAEPALNARPFGQIWCISNAGDDTSIVLYALHAAALEYIRTGVGDERLGLFEWSAPAGADLEDVAALAAANPNLGRRIALDVLLGMARRVKANPHERDKFGVTAEARFRTEVMCQKVDKMNPAVDAAAWKASKVLGDLTLLRARVAACIDVAPDLQHCSLIAAAVLSDGRVRVEIVKVWEGPRAWADMRRDMPKLIAKVRPQVLGWFPGGPAAGLDADIRDRTDKGRARTAVSWPPAGVSVAEITGDTAAACMGFAALVSAGSIVHSAEELLDDHVIGAGKLYMGDKWVFSRKGDGHCDAAYGAAGAVQLARTLPAPVGKPRIVVPSGKGSRVSAIRT